MHCWRDFNIGTGAVRVLKSDGKEWKKIHQQPLDPDHADSIFKKCLQKRQTKEWVQRRVL